MNQSQTIIDKRITKGRVFALLVILMEVGLMYAYAYGAQFDTAIATNGTITSSDNSQYLIRYIMGAILAILGWGLIVSYSQNSAIAGLTKTMIAVGITVQAQPLLFTFWQYVYNLFGSGNTGFVAISLQSETISMVALCSLMVVFCALTGRLGLLETLFVTIFFNIGWPSCFQLLLYFLGQKDQFIGKVNAFDDVGTNYVYLFATTFAFMVSWIIGGKKNEERHSNYGARHPAFIAMIGTGVVFATFPFTAMTPGMTQSINHLYYQSLNIYFALSASVITTYAFSALFGHDGRVGVRQSIIGVLGGGVTIACVAGYIYNIGACITIGAFSGIVSAFWLQKVHPRINNTFVFDQLGIFGPIFVNSVFGGFVLAPCFFAYNYNNDISNDLYLGYAAGKTATTASNTAVFQILIVGIVTALGIGYGLLAGLFCLLAKDGPESKDYHFTKIVNRDFGLYVSPAAPYVIPSDQNITNQPIRSGANI